MFAFMGVLITFLFLIDAVIVTRLHKLLFTKAQEHAEEELELMGIIAREALLKNDYATVEQFLNQWGKEHQSIPVIEIKAISNKNIIFAQYKSSKKANYPVHLRQRIDFAGKELATLEIVYDFIFISEGVRKSAFQLIAVSILLTIILGAILWRTLMSLSVIPLEKEIGERKLVETALQKVKEELEIRVEERTLDLKNAVDDLKNDITERKRVEEALRESEEKFRSAFESSKVGLNILGQDYKYLVVNKAFCDMVGYSEEELLSNHFRNITHPDDIKHNMALSKKLREGEIDSFQLEKRYIHKNGHVVWGSLSVSAVWDAGGKSIYVIALVQDITERKRAEDELHQNKHIVSSSTDMMAMLNKEFTYLSVNTAYIKVFGKSENEFIGHTVSEVFGNEFFNETIKPNALICLAGKEVNYQTWFEFPVTGRKYMDIHYYPYIGVDNEVKGFVVNGRDITDRKQFEQQLIQSEKLSSIGTFISGIAHELNNPLTAILGYSETLMDNENLPQKVKDDLEIISKQSKRTAKIVHELLKYSRTHKEGKVNLDVNNAVGSILDFYSHTFKADDIELKMDLSHDIPKVFADSNQLQQVFTNVIVNAYYEMKKVHGKKVFTVKTVASDEHVFLIFENSGSPIPDDVIGKIFDPFFTSKKVGEGTGLGLYVSYGIIKEHGGDIKAENIGNSGVRFTISLPVTEEKKKKEVETKTKLTIHKGIRLLFVEDEEPIRRYISRVFSKEKISVHMAKDGKEAIELIEKTEYDLILSDIKMPRTNGFELGEWLHKNKPHYMERFVLATGIIDVEVEEYCHKYHCRSIIKPYSKEEILETIAELADKYNLGNKEV